MHGFTINLKKCSFLLNEILFLGFMLSYEGIKPDPNRISTITNFENPKNKNQLQSILGVCNYYRRFAIKHNNYVTPFRDLLGDGTDWLWTDKHTQAFTLLKQNFVKAVCLSHVIPDIPFRVQTDASNYGIAGILFQTDSDKNHCIISLASRCLTPTEMNYTTTELELLAIVYSISKFREYLIGQTFEIVTDHKSLAFLNSTIFHNSRLIRWSLYLQQYSYTVVHCRGKDNTVADFLSRNPESKFHEITQETITIASLHNYSLPQIENDEASSLVIMTLCSEDASLKKMMKNISDEQKRDTACINFFKQLSNKNKDFDHLQIYNDVLFIKEQKSEIWRIVIPKSLKDNIINLTHTKLGHPGVYKTTTYLKRYYYWRTMIKDVKKYILSCDLCQRVKYLTIAMEGPYKLVKAEKPSELVTVDFYGPLPSGRGGVEYVFVVLDAFSKLVRLYAMKKATTNSALKRIIENYIPDCGKFEKILSDNGSQFSSNKWKNELEKLGIEVVYSSIRHPQSNPTERVMREIGRLFRTYCEDKHTSWPLHLNKIQQILNITTHYSTGCAPNELHYGTPLQDEILKFLKFPASKPFDRNVLITFANKNIERSYETRTKRQKPSKVSIKVGDLVLLRVRHLSNALDKVTKKFFHLFEGPFKVKKDLGQNAYLLTEIDNDNAEKGIYNRTNLRKYYQSEI